MHAKLKIGALALALCALAPAGPAVAQQFPSHAGTVEIPLNKSQVISADRDIGKAMVGNEEIADILPISERSIYLLGRKFGTTSLTLYDGNGRVISIMDVSVGPDTEALLAQVHSLYPNQPIDARISNDSIVLTGLVSDAGIANQVKQLAESYAPGKVINLLGLSGSQQVMLEVRFAEVKRDLGTDVGVSGFLQSNGGKFAGAVGRGAQLTPDPKTGVGILGLGSITNRFGVLTRSFTNILGLDVDAALDVLEQRGLSKTLAEPTLVALSGEKASFLAGGEFPIPVVQSAGNNNNQAITVQFKPFGVSLGFTPTVLGDKTINLLVEPEVSSIDPTASITLNGLTIPGLQTRRASTMVELRDGESFAIAGLLQRDFRTTVEQIPLLGSIPIIGSLFRSSSFQKGETELLIIVTPHLVAPIKPSQVVLPTDRVQDPDQLNVHLNGDAYRPVPVEKPSSDADAGSETDVQGGGDYEY